jgi:hypothetical protein
MSEYGADVVKAAEQAFQSPTTLVYKRRVKHVHYVATREIEERFRSPTALTSIRSMRSATSPQKSRENRVQDLLDPRSHSPLRSTQSPLRSTHSNLSAETSMPNIYSDLSRHSSVGRRYQSLIQNADQKALFHQMKNSLAVQIRPNREKKKEKKTDTAKVKSQHSVVYCGGCTDMVLSRHSGEDDERQVPNSDDSANSILLLPICHRRRQPHSSNRGEREVAESFEESHSWSSRSTRSTHSTTTAPSVVNHDPSLDEQTRASSQCDEAHDSVLKSSKNSEKTMMSYAQFFQCMGSAWTQPIDSPKHEPMPTLKEDGFDDAVCKAQCDQAEGSISDESSKAESSVECIKETREESQDTNRSEEAVERLASPIITATSGDGQQVEMSIKPSWSTQESETDGSHGDSCTTSSSEVSTSQSFESGCVVDQIRSQDTNRSEGAVERLATPIITASSGDGQQVEMSVKPRSSTLELETDDSHGDSCTTSSSDVSTNQSFESGCDVEEMPSVEQVESEIQDACAVEKEPSSEQVNQLEGSDMSTGHCVPCGLDEKTSSEQVESKSNIADPPKGSDLSTGRSAPSGLDGVDERPLCEQVESKSSVADPPGASEQVESKSSLADPPGEKFLSGSSDQEEDEEDAVVRQRTSFVEVSSIDSPVIEAADEAEVEVEQCDERATSVKAKEKSGENKGEDSTLRCSEEEVDPLPCAEIDPAIEKANVETMDTVSKDPDPLSEPPVEQQEHHLACAEIDPAMEKACVETKDIAAKDPDPLTEPQAEQQAQALPCAEIDPSREKANVETKTIDSKDPDPLTEPPQVDQREHALLGAEIDPSIDEAYAETKNTVSKDPDPLSEPQVDQHEHTLRSYPSDEFSPGTCDKSRGALHTGDKASKMFNSEAETGESILEVNPDDLGSDSQESSVTLKAGTKSCSRESTPKRGSPKTGTLRTESSSNSPRARTTRSGSPIAPWVEIDGSVEETDDGMHHVLEVHWPEGEEVEVQFSPEDRVHFLLQSPKERAGALSPKEMESLPALFDTRSDRSNENQTSWSPDSGAPETGGYGRRNMYAGIQPGDAMFTFSDGHSMSVPSSTKSISALRVSPAEYFRNTESASSSSDPTSSLETFDRLVSLSSAGSTEEVECDETELRKAHLRSLIQRLTAIPTLVDEQRPETPIPLRSYAALGLTQDLPPQEEYSRDHDLIAKSFRQRDESTKDDLSFMVKAKLVSEFFRSKIVIDDGAIRIAAGDRELLEDFLPAADQLQFIESLRFRVGALSGTPTTLLQRLTLRCKKLGLHRKGAKNPILAAMALTDKSVNIRVDTSNGEDDLLPTDSVPNSPRVDEITEARSGSDSDLAVHLATFDRLMAMPYRSKSVEANGESQLEQIDTWESSLDNIEAFRGTLQRVSALATLSEDAGRIDSPFQGYADLGITENPTISFDLKSDVTNILEGYTPYTPTEPSAQDLRHHDFAFLITASMLVKFFQSRSDFELGRITLKPEDRFTFELLFPHSSILNFVDTVRFRLKDVPVYPVTHVDLVTVQCQKLGLNREGSENPIFVTLSLTNEPAFVDVSGLVGEVHEDWNAKFQASISPTNSRTLGTYFLSVFSADKGMMSPLSSMCMSPTVRSPTAMSSLAVLEEENTVDTETNRDSFPVSSEERQVVVGKVVDSADYCEPIETTPPPRNIILTEVFHDTDIQVEAKAVDLGVNLQNRPSDEILADQSAMTKELEDDEIMCQSSSSLSTRSKTTQGDLEGDISSSNLSVALSSRVRDSSIVPSYSSDDEECSDVESDEGYSNDESDVECSVEAMESVFDDAPSISDLFDDAPSISDLEGSGGSGEDLLSTHKAPALEASGSAIQDPSKTSSIPLLKKKDSGDGLESSLPFPFGSGSSEEGVGVWGYVLDSHLFVVRSEDEEERSRHESNSRCSVERGLDHIWSGVEEWRETVSVDEKEYWTWEGAPDAESIGGFWTTCSSARSQMKYRMRYCNPGPNIINTKRKIPVPMSHKTIEEKSDKMRDEQHSFLNKMEKIWVAAFGYTKKTKSAMSVDDSTTHSLPDIFGAYACFPGGDVPSYSNCAPDDCSLTPSRVSTGSRTTPASPWQIILPAQFTKCVHKIDIVLPDDDDSILLALDDDDNIVDDEEEINLEESSVSSWSRVSYYSDSSADAFASSPWKPVIPIVRCRRSKLALRKAKLGRPSLIAESPKRRRNRGVIL